MSSKHALSDQIKQSPPIDLSIPYDPGWVRGKHIIITGGASGFGAAFALKWASNGASIVVGDINVGKGDSVVRNIRKDTGNEDVHFLHCDVSNWQSQVSMFKEAVKLSPHGGIDVVVANAGIAGPEPLQMPGKLDSAEPPKPNFKVIDVNLTGVLYTTHLALFYLPRNPTSTACAVDANPQHPRDRHLLLIGSVASLMPIPSQPLYGAAKHGVLGLFRTLRASSFVDGVRVNIVCPYFIDTPIIPTSGRLVLAGSGFGTVEDVVDAASRFVADSRISGRSLLVSPKMKVKQQADGEWTLLPKHSEEGEETAVWEAHADDFEDSEAFMRRVIGLLRVAAVAKGWTGWCMDVIAALSSAVKKSLWRS